MAVKESNITCLNCGRQTEKTGEGKYRCAYCGHSFEEDNVQDQAEQMRAELGAGVSIALEQARERDIANARYNLYEAAHEKYTDDEKVLQCARELKKYLPKDVQANFYETAIKRNAEKLNKYINGIDTDKYGYLSDDITEFMLKSMEKRNVLSVKAYIERAYGKDKDKRLEYITKAEDEAEKIDDGIYTAEVPRDVFVAYSSKDRARVNETVEYLESNKISCFVAERNLRHGKGAVARYEELLKTAMDNCKCVVYMSSENSRDLDCDALRVELPYIKSKRKSMGRIEYILDEYGDSTKAGAKKLLKEFFDGLEYCRDTDDLIARIVPYKTKRAEAKDAKYCADCGTENPSAAKLCMECGCRKFFDTQDEYSLFKEQEREKQEEIERIKEETERAKREELERAQRESEQRLAEIERARREEAERLKAEAERIRQEEIEKLKREYEQKLAQLQKQTSVDVEKQDDDESAVKELADKIENAPSVVIVDSIGEMTVGQTTEMRKALKAAGVEYRAVKTSVLSRALSAAGSSFDCSFNGHAAVAFGSTDHVAMCRILVEHEAKTPLVIKGGLVDGKNLDADGVRAFADDKTSSTNALYPDLNNYDKSAFYIDGTTLKKYEGKGGEVVVPQGITDIYSIAFGGCGVKSVIIPDSVTVIGEYAFWDCSSLKSVIIPNSLKSINEGTFCGCSSLTSVNIPDSVTSIGCNAFKGCSSLTSIIIPNSVTVIRGDAFSECRKLTNVTIPNSIIGIWYRTFYGCSGLTSVTIPDSVVRIGNAAFSDCRSLTSIKYGGTKKQWERVVKDTNWNKGCEKCAVYCIDE